MEILPIYNKKQNEMCKRGGLDPSMVYLLDVSKGKRVSKEDWENVKKERLGNLAGMVDFLKSVEKTKLNVEPIMFFLDERLKGEIENHQMVEVISHVISSPSWRERATIMNLLTTLLGKNFKDGFLYGAIAVELAQEAFMIRDDILDEQERCVNKNTVPNIYGKKIADLGKDILLSQARYFLIEAIKKENLDGRKSAKCFRAFEEMVYYDTLGQWMDIASENKDDVSEREYFKMIGYTPGKQFENLTVITCLFADGNDDQTMDNLRRFGKRLGMAAQIRDDIVDIIGNEEVVYKKLGTDVHRRKKRLPLIKYLEENPKDKKYFILRKYPEPPHKELEDILQRMKKNSSLFYCIDKVKELIDEGVFYLETIKEGKEKHTLIQVARLVSNFDERR